MRPYWMIQSAHELEPLCIKQREQTFRTPHFVVESLTIARKDSKGPIQSR